MKNLNIKSLKPYNKALYKDAKTQFDMNMASANRYEHYHKYYEKVVERIKNLELDDIEKKGLIDYLDGYEKRKEEMINILFPRRNFGIEEDGYGTLYNSVYPSALLEFDRQELLTYRMI